MPPKIETIHIVHLSFEGDYKIDDERISNYMESVRVRYGVGVLDEFPGGAACFPYVVYSHTIKEKLAGFVECVYNSKNLKRWGVIVV